MFLPHLRDKGIRVGPDLVGIRVGEVVREANSCHGLGPYPVAFKAWSLVKFDGGPFGAVGVLCQFRTSQSNSTRFAVEFTGDRNFGDSIPAEERTSSRLLRGPISPRPVAEKQRLPEI